MWWLLLLFPLVYGICTFPYYTSAYFRATHLPFLYARCKRGIWGEYRLFRAANVLGGRTAWLFNLYLPKQDRATTEVDAVLIHESGIYVFESKNLTGTVRGTPDARDWSLTAPNGAEYTFYSPLLQNRTHCELVSHLTARNFVYSVIVFGRDTKLDDIPTAHDGHHICTIDTLPALLTALASRVPHQYSIPTQKNLETALVPYTFASRAVRRRHKETLLRQQQKHRLL